jgi:spermidine/putrescine transport system substrate-binding protein
MIKDSLMSQHRIKLLIILFYSSCLILFLYFPRIVNFFSATEKTLNIIIFPEMISSNILEEFSRKTGIKINAKNVETDAEVFVYIADKNTSYDIALVSDYLIPQLINKNSVSPIQKDEIPNYDLIDKIFKSNTNDSPSSGDIIYSTPYIWNIFGIGINTESIRTTKELSWKSLFEPMNQRICLPDDPLALCSIAAIAKGYDLQKLGATEMNAVSRALKEQKKNVEIYTDTNIPLLLVNTVIPLAYASYKTVLLSHEYNKKIQFIIPKEGGLLVTNDWIILERSNNKKLALEFINFCLEKEQAQTNEENTEFLQTNSELLSRLWNESSEENSCPLPPAHIIKTSNHPPSNLPPQLLASLWAELKVYN